MSKILILLKSGIGRTIYTWFLLLSLIPLVLTGWNVIEQSRLALHMQGRDFMVATLYDKAGYISTFFEERLRHLDFHSAAYDNIQFLETLLAAQDKQGKDTETFIKSVEWSQLTTGDGHNSDLKDFQTTYHYPNLYLLDKSGNILFSASSSSLLGKNMLHGQLGASKFGVGVQKALLSGSSVITDLIINPIFGNDPTLFFIRSILNRDGDTIGAVVLQPPLEKLFKFIAKQNGSSTTHESYLVGEDRISRSYTRQLGKSALLSQQIDTSPVQSWLQDNGKDSHNSEVLQHGVEAKGSWDVYKNYKGVEVFGHYTHLPVLGKLGLEWVLISEISVEESYASSDELQQAMFIRIFVTALVVLLAAGFIALRLILPLLQITAWSRQIAAGNFKEEKINASSNELSLLAEAFLEMSKSLQLSADNEKRETWLKEASAQLNKNLRYERTLTQLGQVVSSFLAEKMEASVGVFYVANQENSLQLKGSYAFENPKLLKSELAPGEGVVGQSVLEKKAITLNNLPDNYISVQSSMGSAVPRTLLVYPFIYNGNVEAVIELGSFNEFTDLQMNFLKQAAEGIAIKTSVTKSRVLQEEMLIKTKEQAASLKQQQYDLENSNNKLKEKTSSLEIAGKSLEKTNAKLKEQANSLRASESRLQQQREELRVSNEELEAQAQQLEEQKEIANHKNEQLQAAQLEVENKVVEMAKASKYKSEFLANMSHELRTPLNSLLILSKSLADNEEGNLSEGDVKDAEIIYGSASDLLSLINQILDLAKIEAGRMDVHPERLILSDMAANLDRQFRPVAEKANLEFNIEFIEGSVDTIFTDPEKAVRIVKNLLSNAFKFTSKGRVTLRISPPTQGWILNDNKISTDGGVVIAVHDTGIGISDDKHQAIFEAFQQEDGSTSRQYGGTGLGLSISYQLSKLLLSKIHLESAQGKGSVFSLFLAVLPDGEVDYKTTHTITSVPIEKPVSQRQIELPTFSMPSIETNKVDDTQEKYAPGDRLMLVIEDDENFATVIVNMAQKTGFKCITAHDGESGLALAIKHKPASIILDIGLPGMDGWEVLDKLKYNSETRHIPVHIMSAMDDNIEGLKRGAVGYCNKPVTKSHIEEAFAKMAHFAETEPRSLLLVEDDELSRNATAKLLAGKDIEIVETSTGADTLEVLKVRTFDCMILDLGLPDMSGFDLLDIIAADASLKAPPVIVYSGRELSRQEYDRLKAYTNSFVVKGVQSSERLLNEVILFLHRMERDLPDEQRTMIRKLYDQDNVFVDKTVLIVDDDVSNLYAMAKQLERKDLKTVMAADGQKALDMLEKHPEVDIVLMDIMMPVMDGYVAMGEIRKLDNFKNLPIIALTAKAMSDDKKKCLDAGASDYLTKPVDMGKLFSLMKVWLHRDT
ncbi:MAG: response regulator [Magnetococcales bacterium]|nr:response regulator [Magnetococcales bacterium]